MIHVYETGRNIFGTSQRQYLYTSDRFPKLEVTLYSAPVHPEKVIAFSYLECIEDRDYSNPEEIKSNEARKIADWVLKGGHTPALEAIYLHFNIRGMSKVVSHQLVRHRIGISIDQRTQRANSEKFLGKFHRCNHFVLPPSFNKISDELKSRLYDFNFEVETVYNLLLKEGISQDDARYIIPQAAETSMNVKIIYKAFQMACATRLCHLMQHEMSEIFRMMHTALLDYSPLLGQYCQPICMINGKCNRNENNSTEEYPKGVCIFTQNGVIPVREKDNTFDLTKYSKDNSK